MNTGLRYNSVTGKIEEKVGGSVVRTLDDPITNYVNTVPNTDETLDLGSSSKKFDNIYAKTVNYTTLNPAVSGYTNLTQFVDQTAWRSFYSDGSGDIKELAFGSIGKVLTSGGASAAPTWESVPAGYTDKMAQNAVGNALGTGLAYNGGTGAISLSYLGLQSLTDPNADRVMFWDDTAGALTWLSMGNSVAITTTTLDTIQDIRTSATPRFERLGLGMAADATLSLDAANGIRCGGGASAQSVILRGLVVNEDGGATNADNFRVEGDTDENAIFVNSSNNRVGIGTATPATKLDVNGVTTSDNFISDVAVGTAPFACTSTTLNTNLNADLLDGQHGSYYSAKNTITVSTTSVGNVGAGEDTLITYSLAAILDANAKGVRITAWGTTPNNANAKTLKMYFGSTAIVTDALPVNQVNVWKIVAEVIRTAASAEESVAYIVRTATIGTGTDIENTQPAENTANAITIKCTGEATSNDDIVQRGLIIEPI